MRVLSKSEIHHIAGAGYSEDIVTTAASIYVGSKIGAAAAALTEGTFAVAAGLLGTSPLVQEAIALGGTAASPCMFFAAPVYAFECAYPGLIKNKIQSYLA